MQVEAKQLEKLNMLAEKLILRCDDGARNILERKEQLNGRWENLKGRGAERKRHLERALEVYAFQKSCDELLDNVNEKVW